MGPVETRERRAETKQRKRGPGKRNRDSVSGEATKVAQAASHLAEHARLVEARWSKKLERIWAILAVSGVAELMIHMLPEMPNKITDNDLEFLVETGGPKALLRKR